MKKYDYSDKNNNAFENGYFSLADEKTFLDRMYEYRNNCRNGQKGSGKDSSHGTIGYPFITTDHYHFESFCFYLRSHGYDIMKSSYKRPYRVYVFGLTEQEATMLRERFYGDRNFAPFSGGGQAA